MRLELDCMVEYLPSFLSKKESKELFDYLMNEEQLTRGATVVTTEGVIIQDTGKLSFITEELKRNNLLPIEQHGANTVWSKQMDIVRKKIEKIVYKSFDVCVCIYYPDGTSGVDFHSDLVSFGDTSCVPSLSLGATRIFQLREKKSGDIHQMELHSGDLLVMGDHCQERYEHAVPLDPLCLSPRINLTFRPYGFK